MDERSISELAEMLRKTGDEVLLGNKTLHLSDILLKNLEDSFKYLTEEEYCDTSFLVTKTNNSKVAVFRDVQFLHDFIQKVVSVCVTKETKYSENILDISKFKSLRMLELRKIPVQNICGIQQARSRLQRVVCVHCFQQLQDLFVNCGADQSTALLWEELTEGVFSYSALESIDSSFLYTPLLQIIDLSHNKLKSFCVESFLPNLKFLNLSYNLLQSIPVLGKEASCKLKTLLIRNNYLQNLVGLEKLNNLTHLDVSCNSLYNHCVLEPLERLPLLVCLNVVGNPLSFHIQHRFHTVAHLHLNIATSRFMLNGHSLSRQEKNALKHVREQRRPRKEEPLSVETREDSQENQQSEATSVGYVQGNQSTRSKRQRHHVKEAVIEESFDAEKENTDFSLPGDGRHLEAKRRVEALRRRFGEERWLSEHAATQLHSALGLQLPAPPPPTLPSPSCSVSTQGSSTTCVAEISIHPHPMEASQPLLPRADSPVSGDDQQDGVELQDAEEKEEEDEEEEEEEEEEMDEEKMFAVREAGASSELLFLIVGTHHLMERDVKSGRVQERWEFDVLQSCELLSDAVRLTFNVLQRDRRCRVYLMDDSEAKVLASFLGGVLASRSLSDMNQIAYRCMKCSTQFCKEEDVRLLNKGHATKCPSCGSSIVCMTEEAPLPSTFHENRPPESALPSSFDQLSHHSTSSLPSSQFTFDSPKNASMTSSATMNANDQQQSPVAVVHPDASSSSTSGTSSLYTSTITTILDRERSAASLESESVTSGTSTRHCDSDIEVISNPSQSSIEVLDGETKVPSRKRSSEERQSGLISAENNVKAAQTPTLPPIGLTESSSSDISQAYGSICRKTTTMYNEGDRSQRKAVLFDQDILGMMEVEPKRGVKIPQNISEYFEVKTDVKPGSFTDSICTTYEVQKFATTGSTSDDQYLVQQQKNGASTKFVEMPIPGGIEYDSLYSEESIPNLQEMFEGLLEKVDQKLAKSAEIKSPSSRLDNNIQYSYSDFQQVDHRLRLYLLQEVLQSDAEQLLLVLRANVLKCGEARPFPGILVFSCDHLWLLQIIGVEGDNPESWLQKNLQLPVSCVRCVFPLPWDQGVGVECGDANHQMLMLLQDCQRTYNFIDAAESLLPMSCGVIREPATYHHQRIKKLSSVGSTRGEQNEKLDYVSLFNSFNLNGAEESSTTNGLIIVRTSDILVVESNLSWLFRNTSDDAAFKTVATQQISDLMDVETDGCHIHLHFMDEIKNDDEVWNIAFETAACVQNVVAACRSPWEKIFSVPLQVVGKNTS